MSAHDQPVPGGPAGGERRRYSPRTHVPTPARRIHQGCSAQTARPDGPAAGLQADVAKAPKGHAARRGFVSMTVHSATPNLSNIQGNILRGYASFPHALFLFLNIRSADGGRTLLRRLLDSDAVTPAQWRNKPDAALNLAVTFEGLRALGLPQESLATFPAEFQEGMRRRAKALGDVGESSADHWDEPWKTHRVHILVMMYGKTAEALDARYRTLKDLLPPDIHEL